MGLTYSQLDRLADPNFFFWATGIEDTFITEPWPATGRTLDEYELTGHYQRWRDDLGLMAELGVTHARYGIPWHKVNPRRGSWDWEFADKTLNRLLELEIEPIVDLVHYGLPLWIEQSWLDPDLPKFMAEYTARITERFKGRIYLWTPLNEPRITAWYCGKLGWWPPFLKGWTGFLKVIIAVSRCIVESARAIRESDPENIVVHVDATDLYESPDPNLRGEAARRQEIVFLALDLVSGRVDERHALYPWLRKGGISAADLEWFQLNRAAIDFAGINLYPLFSRKVLTRAPRLRIKMPYASAEIVHRLARMYHERYQCPVFISETASLGTVKRRAQWLADSVAAVRRARASGVPLAGYTWWPLFALVTWSYRQGTNSPAYYLKQMGLWDLEEGAGGALDRVWTPLVEQFQRLARGETAQTAGTLGAVSSPSAEDGQNANERFEYVS